MKPLRGGPDAARYIALAEGRSVPRPFHVRWFLPYVCGTSAARWWAVWLWSWPLMALGFVAWRHVEGDSLTVALTGCALLLALPGILGPSAVIPVGVDLPSTAYTLLACALFAHGGSPYIIASAAVMVIAASMKETAPVFAALWLWSPWPLVALVPPALWHLFNRPGPDPLGARFDEIAAHPFRSALAAHAGRWRDGWLMVAPWGVCLAALHSPDWRLMVVLAVAYAQLLVATDTVRLVQHAAGPPMAAAAAAVIPPQFVLLALAVHVVWWRTPERI